MTERRFNAEEVTAILLSATETPRTLPLQPTRDVGLTLAEVQEIGGELEIPAEAVAQAAHSVQQSLGGASLTFFGLPIGVERTTALNRWVTEQEWEQLVAELRTVFKAPGKITSYGSFHQWANGNLHAILEPTATGHRLRLWTVKGNARVSMASGLAILGVTAAVAIASAAGGQFGHAVPGIGWLFLVGLGMVANGALRLPSWARLRRRQMDTISAGLAFSADPGAGHPPPTSLE